MDHKKIAELWDKNAEAWQEASESGYDKWRDFLNTPAFLEILPDISELNGLDIGCGDGYNTRLIAQRCKTLTAIDLSDRFLAYNKKFDSPGNISYQQINAAKLPFPNEYFDFATSTMSFMDAADMDKILNEAFRVLKPNGFLQFSIVHPCFNEQKGYWLKDEAENRTSFVMKDYFKESNGEIHEWQHPSAPTTMKNFIVPRFWRPLSKWLNLLSLAGFSIDEVCEPYASESIIAEHPELASTKVVAHSLIIRVSKKVKLNYLEKIIAKLPGNVWWKDKNLVYLGCNDRVIEVLGLSSHNQFVGKTDQDLWPKEIADKLMEADLHVLKTGEKLTLEEVIVQNDGAHITMLTNKSPFYDDSQNIIGIVGTSINITERKKQEKELKEAKENAEAANRLKTEFMFNMEHDLRTPFSGLYGIANLLEEDEKDPERKQFLAAITTSAKELLDYVNEILDFTKLESGYLPILSKKMSLQAVINRIISIETPTAKNKNLELVADIKEDIPEVVIGDKARIEKILFNLVGNALKFTNEGSVVIRAEVAKRTDNNIVIHLIVEDTGIGISEEVQAHIYEKFVRGTLSNRGIYKGLGLGMNLVKQLITEIDGEIDVISEVEKGTKFICTIPFKLPLIDEIFDSKS